MTAQTLKLAGKTFVVVEESQFRKLVRAAGWGHRMTQQDWGDVAESKRRLAKPGVNIPWEQIKAEKLAASGKRMA